MTKRKILFILFFVFGLLLLCSNSSSAVVHEAHYNENNDYVINFTVFNTKGVRNDTLTIPAKYDSYNYFICAGARNDNYYIFYNEDTTLDTAVIVPTYVSSPDYFMYNKVLFYNYDFTIRKGCSARSFMSDGTSLSTSTSYGSNKDFDGITPSCIIYSHGLNIYFTNKLTSLPADLDVYLSLYKNYGNSHLIGSGIFVNTYQAYTYPFYNTEFYDFSKNGLSFNLHGNYTGATLKNEYMSSVASLSNYNLRIYSYSDYDNKTRKDSFSIPYSVFYNYIYYDDNLHSYICNIPLSEFPDGFIVENNYYYIDFEYSIGFLNTFIASESLSGEEFEETAYKSVANYTYKEDFFYTGNSIIPPGTEGGETGGGEGGEETLTPEQQVTQSIDDMKKALLEAIGGQTEQSKGIFETIKEIISYLNPFSENFFAYKLVELLLDGIKSLFIPSDEFFSNFFTDLREWFSDRLGFLFYPFDLIIEVLNKIISIDFSEPIFNIPDINEPFTNTKIINATTFNLNSILTGGLKTAHDIYLICVDAFIIIGVVNLAKRKFEEVMSK